MKLEIADKQIYKIEVGDLVRLKTGEYRLVIRVFDKRPMIGLLDPSTCKQTAIGEDISDLLRLLDMDLIAKKEHLKLITTL